MDIRILGVSGSPVKGGNTEAFLKEALKAAEGFGAQTELIPLSGKEVRDCLHCNWCVRKQEEGKFCNQHDFMQEVYPKLLEADGLILATPVYFTRLSGYMACFMDRLRCFAHGNYYKGRLRDNVGGAMAVAWYRNMGLETALLSIVVGLLALDIIPVTPRLHGAPEGATALASEHGEGKFDPKDRLGVLHDEYGLSSAKDLAQRMVERVRLVKAGQEALRAAGVLPGV